MIPWTWILSAGGLAAAGAGYGILEAKSLRVRRITAGDAVGFRPHDTRYTCAYPRSFYLSVAYSF